MSPVLLHQSPLLQACKGSHLPSRRRFKLFSAQPARQLQSNGSWYPQVNGGQYYQVGQLSIILEGTSAQRLGVLWLRGGTAIKATVICVAVANRSPLQRSWKAS